MNFQAIIEAGFWVQFHLVTVFFAIVLTVMIFTQKKGSRHHKALGRTWCVTMLVLALGSFFIHELNPPNGFSLIHLISVWTIFSVLLGWRSARKQKVKAHRATMTSLVFGALVIAGLFTLMPGRVMNSFIFGL